MSVAPVSDRPVLSAVARTALVAAGGDVQKATRILADRARAEPDLLTALMWPMIDLAAYDAVRKVCREDRRTIWTTPQPTGDEARARVVALAGGTMATLLDFPLPGGKRLGDALRAEVVEAGDFFQRQAADMGIKSRWLRLVAQAVPDGKTVADVLSADRLKQLREEATR